MGGPLAQFYIAHFVQKNFCAKQVHWTTGYNSINVYGYAPTRVYRGFKNIKNIPRDESSVPLGHYNIKLIKIYRLIYKNGSEAHYFTSYQKYITTNQSSGFCAYKSIL